MANASSISLVNVSKCSWIFTPLSVMTWLWVHQIKHIIYSSAKKLAKYLTIHYMRIFTLLCMSQKIKYMDIIFPDYIYDEIQSLQKELSHKDSRVWSISSTVNLLLRFCLHEDGVIYDQNASFLRDYLYAKESFLEDFTSRIFMSAH